MKTLLASFTLIAATIGIGILALPYTFSRSGLVPAITLLIIALVLTVTINLLYVEVLLHVKGKHQFAGYAGLFFGKTGKVLATVALLVGAYGACLAYIIQGGIFLNTAFPLLSEFYFSLLFFLMISLVGLMNMKLFSELQSIMVGVLLVLITVLSIVGIAYISPQHFDITSTKLSEILLPYGVLLFAFSGYSIIPEVGEITQYNRRSLRKAVIVGTGVVALVYVVFSTVILGITGEQVSEDAVVGLTSVFGADMVKYIALVALLPVTTSYISLSRVAQDLFVRDLKIHGPLGWFFALYPPMLLFLTGGLGIVKVLEISGGITVGLTGALLVAIYFKMASQKHVPITASKRVWYVLVAAVFIAGIVYEVTRGF